MRTCSVLGKARARRGEHAQDRQITAGHEVLALARREQRLQLNVGQHRDELLLDLRRAHRRHRVAGDLLLGSQPLEQLLHSPVLVRGMPGRPLRKQLAEPLRKIRRPHLIPQPPIRVRGEPGRQRFGGAELDLDRLPGQVSGPQMPAERGHQRAKPRYVNRGLPLSEHCAEGPRPVVHSVSAGQGGKVGAAGFEPATPACKASLPQRRSAKLTEHASDERNRQRRSLSPAQRPEPSRPAT
jgi:hypothetical protein